MKYTLCFLLFNTVLLSLHSQNLILNSSFEQHLDPYCKGWYSVCNKEISCDSLGDCNTQIFEDSPGDSTVNKWCLLVWGHSWPFETYVDYYVTGRTGTFIYQLDFWMNTLHMYGYGRLGILDHGVFIQKDSVGDLSAPWTEYVLRDTLTTTATDTIVVRLAAGIGDFCLCDVYFDQVELNVLDSLPTKVEPVSQVDDFSVFPNPVYDQLEIIGNAFAPFFITILNDHGQIILEKESHDKRATIDLTMLPSGVYFYKIAESKKGMAERTGKFVKA